MISFQCRQLSLSCWSRKAKGEHAGNGGEGGESRLAGLGLGAWLQGLASEENRNTALKLVGKVEAIHLKSPQSLWSGQ